LFRTKGGEEKTVTVAGDKRLKMSGEATDISRLDWISAFLEALRV